MKINNNVNNLSKEEVLYLQECKWYSYVYDVGLILLPDGSSWDCSNTVEAKAYLDNLGVQEKHR